MAAEIFADFRKKGKHIGHTDALIARMALANDLQPAINNTEHFIKVKGL